MWPSDTLTPVCRRILLHSYQLTVGLVSGLQRRVVQLPISSTFMSPEFDYTNADASVQK